ncbi:hypothetical protein AVEN_237870-1, partial [Araneus ventricosus]
TSFSYVLLALMAESNCGAVTPRGVACQPVQWILLADGDQGGATEQHVATCCANNNNTGLTLVAQTFGGALLGNGALLARGSRWRY